MPNKHLTLVGRPMLAIDSCITTVGQQRWNSIAFYCRVFCPGAGGHGGDPSSQLAFNRLIPVPQMKKIHGFSTVAVFYYVILERTPNYDLHDFGSTTCLANNTLGIAVSIERELSQKLAHGIAPRHSSCDRVNQTSLHRLLVASSLLQTWLASLSLVPWEWRDHRYQAPAPL